MLFKTDGPAIQPQGILCWYPTCEELRVADAIYCAGHELFWRANYEIPSQYSTAAGRSAFYYGHWETAKVEALEILSVAGAPASSKASVGAAIDRAAARYDQEQQHRNGVGVSLPPVETIGGEALGDYIIRGVANGVLARALGDRIPFIHDPSFVARVGSHLVAHEQLDHLEGCVGDKDATKKALSESIERILCNGLGTKP